MVLNALNTQLLQSRKVKNFEVLYSYIKQNHQKQIDVKMMILILSEAILFCFQDVPIIVQFMCSMHQRFLHLFQTIHSMQKKSRLTILGMIFVRHTLTIFYLQLSLIQYVDFYLVALYDLYFYSQSRFWRLSCWRTILNIDCGVCE